MDEYWCVLSVSGLSILLFTSEVVILDEYLLGFVFECIISRCQVLSTGFIGTRSDYYRWQRIRGRSTILVCSIQRINDLSS